MPCLLIVVSECLVYVILLYAILVSAYYGGKNKIVFINYKALRFLANTLYSFCKR